LPDNEAPLRLNEILLRASANDPALRYVSVEEMHDDLARLRDGEPLARRGRRRWPMAAAILVFIGLASSLAYVAHVRAGLGSAMIETEPPGAMVVLGDTMKRSPAQFVRLPAGAHKATIMLS